MASHLKQGVEKRQWDSTAGAAMSLVNPTGEDGIGAAICSKNVADLHPELEVLAEGIQDRQRKCAGRVASSLTSRSKLYALPASYKK